MADEDGPTATDGGLWRQLQDLPTSEDDEPPSVHEDPDYWHRAPTGMVGRVDSPAPPDRTRVLPSSEQVHADPTIAPPGSGTGEPHRYHIPAPVEPPAAPPDEYVAPRPSAPPAPPRPTRRRWPRRLLVVVLVLVAALLGAGLYGWMQFRDIPRVDVGDSLASGGSGTNYLIVGSDSRAGLDPDDPALNGAETLGGQRADTMMILRTEGDAAYLLSIPRDLWVTLVPDGDEAKINAAYNQSPEAVISTITQSVGIPIHRYLEVDFVSFEGLVDAVGGVTINFPHPARDRRSGLDISETGPVRLNGTQALSYVRSRTYSELIDGEWVTDQRAPDLSRVARQKAFMSAVLGELTSTTNPLAANRALQAAKGGLRIDDGMTFFDALRLAVELRGQEYEIVELPVTPFAAPDGSSALQLADGAQAVIDLFSN